MVRAYLSDGGWRRKLHCVRLSMVVWLSLITVAVLDACDDAPPPAATAVSAPAPAAVEQPTGTPAMAMEPPRLELSEKDFVEAITNRDPFRSYLAEFLTPATRTAKIQRKVILARYGLDELQLIAVIAGDAERARAMFRDPAGLGVSVKRGDYISKSAGRVKAIESDKVVVEIQETLEGGQTVADRVVELHPIEERARELSEEEQQP